MTKRLGLFLALGIVQIVACGGDEPGAPGGASSSSGGGADSGSGLNPQLDVRVAPVVLLRGQGVRLPVQVLRRDTVSSLSLQLRGVPAGITSNTTELLLSAGESTTEFSLLSAAEAVYGDYSLQLAVKGADVESVVPISLQVRGEPGALDTSFGVGGSAAQVPSGKIGDLLVDSQGRYVVTGGFDAAGDTMLMARLTPLGQLDTTFGNNGALRWDAPFDMYSHLEMRPGYYRRSVIEWNGGYSLTAFLENASTGIAIHSEISQAGAAPSLRPTTRPADLGSVNGGSRLIRDVSVPDNDTQYFRFRFGCTITKYFEGGQVNPNFGNQGTADLVGGGGCSVLDAIDTSNRLFVVLSTTDGSAIRTVVRADEKDPNDVLIGGGTVLAPTHPVPTTPTSSGGLFLSRPNAAGKVLTVVGTTLYEIGADGEATILKGKRFDPALQPSSARSGLAWYFPDGRIGVILYGALRPNVHVLDATGEDIGPASGFELDEPSFATFKGFVEAYPDPRGGLVLLYPQGDPATDLRPWTIKRFWL